MGEEESKPRRHDQHHLRIARSGFHSLHLRSDAIRLDFTPAFVSICPFRSPGVYRNLDQLHVLLQCFQLYSEKQVEAWLLTGGVECALLSSPQSSAAFWFLIPFATRTDSTSKVRMVIMIVTMAISTEDLRWSRGTGDGDAHDDEEEEKEEKKKDVASMIVLVMLTR